MTSSTENKAWIGEEFMALSKDGHCYELVNGELMGMGNSGMKRGYVACILEGWDF